MAVLPSPVTVAVLLSPSVALALLLSPVTVAVLLLAWRPVNDPVRAVLPSPVTVAVMLSPPLASALLKSHRVPRLAPLHRAAVDYDRSTVRSASEEVRCMRDQFARIVAPGQPKRLRGDADHCRVEIQRHHVIAFHPRLEADVPAGRGRPPQPAQMPLPLV